MCGLMASTNGRQRISRSDARARAVPHDRVTTELHTGNIVFTILRMHLCNLLIYFKNTPNDMPN